MDSHQQAWMQAQSRLQELEASMLRMQADLDAANYELSINPAQTKSDIDTLRGKILEIDRELATTQSHHAIEIRAPGAGVVTAVAGHPGQAVAPGSPLLTIVPQGDPIMAELLAPSGAIGFVHPGQRVLLRYSAFPYQKFGQYPGTVVSVSDAALRPEEAQILAGGAAQKSDSGPFYRVTVRPDRQSVTVYGREQPLPASMQVAATVLLDHRPLWQWIVDPLFGLGRAARAG
jgi:membrane fusion protein